MFVPEQKIESAVLSPKAAAYNPAMRSVFFDEPRKILAATDGHIMAMVPAAPHDGDKGGLIPVHAISSGRRIEKQSRKLAKERGDDPTKNVEINLSADRCIIADKTGEIAERVEVIRAIDDFPDYFPVIESACRDAGIDGRYAICFDLRLLVSLCEALSRGARKQDPLTVTMWIDKGTDERHGGRSCVVVVDDGLGVLMGLNDCAASDGKRIARDFGIDMHAPKNKTEDSAHEPTQAEREEISESFVEEEQG